MFCPLCAKNNTNELLSLYSINLNEGVYLCNNAKCTYPLGIGEVLETVNMDKSHDSTPIKLDIKNSIPLVMPVPLPGYGLDGLQYKQLTHTTECYNKEINSSFENNVGLLHREVTNDYINNCTNISNVINESTVDSLITKEIVISNDPSVMIEMSNTTQELCTSTSTFNPDLKLSVSNPEEPTVCNVSTGQLATEKVDDSKIQPTNKQSRNLKMLSQLSRNKRVQKKSPSFRIETVQEVVKEPSLSDILPIRFSKFSFDEIVFPGSEEDVSVLSDDDCTVNCVKPGASVRAASKVNPSVSDGFDLDDMWFPDIADEDMDILNDDWVKAVLSDNVKE